MTEHQLSQPHPMLCSGAACSRLFTTFSEPPWSPHPFSYPGSQAGLHLLAEETHQGQGQAVGWPHALGERRLPPSKPDGPQTTQGRLSIPRATGDSLPDPRGLQPGHTQLAWMARDRGSQLPRVQEPTSEGVPTRSVDAGLGLPPPVV